MPTTPPTVAAILDPCDGADDGREAGLVDQTPPELLLPPLGSVVEDETAWMVC